jgi:AcrR family transcriptional regulator
MLPEVIDSANVPDLTAAPTLAGDALAGAPRTSRRPPGRRESLLAAALDVIRRVGPSASMDEMAAEAGITKPVLYRYFGDRDGLITALADQFADVLVERLELALRRAARATEANVDEVIRQAIDSYVGFIEEDPALYGFLTQHAAPEHPALVAVIERVAGSIAGIIRENFTAQGFDPRPAETFAHGIVGMVHLAGASWARNHAVSREELVGDLAALVSRGLVGAATPLQPQ